MPPLVMPWRARNPSSVRTSTSKIALPIPRTSYFVSAIKDFRLWQLRQRRRRRIDELACVNGAATYHVPPGASKRLARQNAFMIRPVLIVSTGTLVSRLLGFTRDALVAALLGTGPVADAFLIAFQGINVMRRALTEGSLNAALVPAWLRIRHHDGAIAAAVFAGRVLGSVSLAMIVAALLIGLAMPLVITALAPGFAGGDSLTPAVDTARLMLPYLAFAGPVAVM